MNIRDDLKKKAKMDVIDTHEYYGKSSIVDRWLEDSGIDPRERENPPKTEAGTPIWD